jgi:hypothetical protein
VGQPTGLSNKSIDIRNQAVYKIFMNKFMASMSIFSAITISVAAGITVSCVNTKDNGSNKVLARMELDLLMFQIENKIIRLDALSDKKYIELGHKFSGLVTIIGKTESQKTHYFRAHFSRAPGTLDEMAKIILDSENNIFAWELLPWQNMAFHMYGKDGEYNLKFISADGHFEAVYNRAGILLTQENDPLNMGTFNYAHQVSDQMTHYNLDIWPYFVWNNTSEAMQMMEKNNTEKTKPVAIDKNEDAMRRYKEYEELLSKKQTEHGGASQSRASPPLSGPATSGSPLGGGASGGEAGVPSLLLMQTDRI